MLIEKNTITFNPLYIFVIRRPEKTYWKKLKKALYKTSIKLLPEVLLAKYK